MRYFVECLVLVQTLYFLVNYFKFMENTISWLAITIATIGPTFGWGFGFTQEIYFWIGYAIFIIGFFLMFYPAFEEKFLPQTINKIVLHPKLLNPYG